MDSSASDLSFIHIVPNSENLDLAKLADVGEDFVKIDKVVVDVVKIIVEDKLKFPNGLVLDKVKAMDSVLNHDHLSVTFQKDNNKANFSVEKEGPVLLVNGVFVFDDAVFQLKPVTGENYSVLVEFEEGKNLKMPGTNKARLKNRISNPSKGGPVIQSDINAHTEAACDDLDVAKCEGARLDLFKVLLSDEIEFIDGIRMVKEKHIRNYYPSYNSIWQIMNAICLQR